MGIYHEAMLIKRKQWKESQYPEEWSFKVKSKISSKTLGAKLLSTNTETRATDDKRDVKLPMLTLQNREEKQLFANNVRSITNSTICFDDQENENRFFFP